jgi:hypothetical protein
MARTCSKVAHKSGLHADFRLRNFSKSCTDIQFHCTPLRSHVTCKPWWTSPSSNWQNCSTHIALRFCKWRHGLNRASLGDNQRWNHLVSHCFWLPFRPSEHSVADSFRPLLPRGRVVAAVRRSRPHWSVASGLQGHHDTCNTLGVCHSLSSGFELKHDRLSGDDDVKVNLWRWA